MTNDKKISLILNELRNLDRAKCKVTTFGENFRDAYKTIMDGNYTDIFVRNHRAVGLLFPGTSEIELYANHYAYSDILYPWSMNKITYTFDKDVEESILQTDVENIPISVLEFLPHKTIFISMSDDVCDGFGQFFEDHTHDCADAPSSKGVGDSFHYSRSKQPVIGVFITNRMKDTAVGRSGLLLGIATAADDGLAIWSMYMGKPDRYDTMTVGEYVHWLCYEYYQSDFYKGSPDQDEKDEAVISAEVFTIVFSYIAYLSSKNAEIEQTKSNKLIYRPASSIASVYLPKHRYSEVKQMICGEQTGVRLRSFKKAKSERGKGSGRKGSIKSPHVRRAHYHTYWRGHGSDKHVELKWLEPMLIHPELTIDIRPTDVLVD